MTLKQRKEEFLSTSYSCAALQEPRERERERDKPKDVRKQPGIKAALRESKAQEGEFWPSTHHHS